VGFVEKKDIVSFLKIVVKKGIFAFSTLKIAQILRGLFFAVVIGNYTIKKFM
jgi:hypothetical protein